MSRLEAAAAMIVGECVLARGRAMTLACVTLDGQIWRVECERVESEEHATVSREQLREALSHATAKLAEAAETIAEQAALNQEWVSLGQKVKSGLRAIHEALGGEGHPQNVKDVVDLARQQIQLRRDTADEAARWSEINYQIYKALRALLQKLGAPASAPDAACLALIQDIDEHVQAQFRELSEVRS